MSGRAAPRRVIVAADDFGLTPAVNEAIERAHRDGALGTASLMVAGPAAADAVARARRLPGLSVGLHLAVIEARACLAPAEIPRLVARPDGWFGSDQLALGLAYVRPAVVRELAREIRAQFEAFARTGLRLDHANAHKHMHLHPVVGHLMLSIGREFGLGAVRVPSEPAVAGITGGGALRAWSRLLRAQVARAGMRTTRHCFGLAWSGGMTQARLSRLLDALPPGSSEIYFHPAAGRDALLDRLMPHYRHEAELDALLDPELGRRLAPLSVRWDAL